MLIIKLTDRLSGEPIYINFEKVHFFEIQYDKERSSYTFIQFEDRSIKVLELPETIHKMIKEEHGRITAQSMGHAHE